MRVNQLLCVYKHVRERMKAAVRRVMESNDPGVLRVAIDCSWDDPSVMSDRHVRSLAKQVTAAYGLNFNSPKPCHLYLTGLKRGGRIEKAFYEHCIGFERFLVDRSEELHHELFQPADLVYLSPDAENVLQSLDTSKVYVIGGIVDKPICKGLTKYNAYKFDLNSMRLPIKELMSKKPNTNSIGHCNLAINQVLGILLSVYASGDWASALEKHMPKRKGYIVQKQTVVPYIIIILPLIIRCFCIMCTSNL